MKIKACQSSNLMFALALIGISILMGCSKNNIQQRTTATSLLDTVVYGNYKLNYLYDSRDRVVEERYFFKDTIQERCVYFYNGNDSFPYKRDQYRPTSTSPIASSFFIYNGARQKIYDSTITSTTRLITDINRNPVGVIVVSQKAYRTAWIELVKDSIFLNGTGNIDKIRTYYDMRTGVLKYNGEFKYTQYDSHANTLKTLSIAACNFYIAGNPYGLASFQNASTLSLDFYNNNFLTVAAFYKTDGTVFSNWQNAFTFNANNQPVSQILSYPSVPSSYTYQFVYK